MRVKNYNHKSATNMQNYLQNLIDNQLKSIERGEAQLREELFAVLKENTQRIAFAYFHSFEVSHSSYWRNKQRLDE